MKKALFSSVSVLLAALSFGVAAPLALAANAAPVNLGSAATYAILTKTGVSTTGTTVITGDVGLSPAAASYITGFALTLPAASAFSTSALVTGKVYAPGYADPTPANLTTAVLDMQNAYTDAASRAATVTELGAGNIGGLTLVPGVYKWGTNVTIPTNLTLAGDANDVWIFQIAGNLNISSATSVVLVGGAQAGNVFWQVAGQTTLGTTSVFSGNILDQTTIVLNTGARLNGRALAQAAVTLDSNVITLATVSASATPATPATPAVSATPETRETSVTTWEAATPATPAIPATSAVTASHPSGLSAGQVQAILDVLASFSADASIIANVRASLGGVSTGSVTSAAAHVFKTNFSIGSLGSEVKDLQQYLNGHGYVVSTEGAGSEGNETTLFGEATKTALIKFQEAHNIWPATGDFGPKTRAAIEADN
jgi:hypothetical protein